MACARSDAKSSATKNATMSSPDAHLMSVELCTRMGASVSASRMRVTTTSRSCTPKSGSSPWSASTSQLLAIVSTHWSRSLRECVRKINSVLANNPPLHVMSNRRGNFCELSRLFKSVTSMPRPHSTAATRAASPFFLYMAIQRPYQRE